MISIKILLRSPILFQKYPDFQMIPKHVPWFLRMIYPLIKTDMLTYIVYIICTII